MNHLQGRRTVRESYCHASEKGCLLTCRSVVELVSWFSRNSLKEAFSGLDATLRFSVGELSLVEATFDFSPPAAVGVNAGDKGNMLPLKVTSTDLEMV